jgi:hypothetical protein
MLTLLSCLERKSYGLENPASVDEKELSFRPERGCSGLCHVDHELDGNLSEPSHHRVHSNDWR